MLKRKIIHDERISQIKRKITNEAFGIMFFALTGIVFVKSVMLKIPTNEFITEFILWIGISFYVCGRMLMEGIFGQNVRNAKKSRRILSMVLSDVIFTLSMGALQYIDGTLNIWFLIGSALVFFFAFWGVLKIADRIAENRMRADD